MRYLTEEQVLELHRRVIEQSGGGDGMRDLGAFQSAVAQPQLTFGGTDLYPTIEKKAAALLFSLVLNHPFVDGNKRIGHFACETFLLRTVTKLSPRSMSRSNSFSTSLPEPWIARVLSSG